MFIGAVSFAVCFVIGIRLAHDMGWKSAVFAVLVVVTAPLGLLSLFLQDVPDMALLVWAVSILAAGLAIATYHGPHYDPYRNIRRARYDIPRTFRSR